MKWQEVALLLLTAAGAAGLVSYVSLFGALFQLTGMDYTYTGDINCTFTCESYINVTTSYWRICFEHSTPDQRAYLPGKYRLEKTTIGEHPETILFKKSTYGRTLWVNLNNVDNIVSTEPRIEVDWLVPTYGKRWRPLKDGDCWDRGKVNKIKLVGHKDPTKTVKWTFMLDEDELNIDPLWAGNENLIRTVQSIVKGREEYKTEDGHTSVIFRPINIDLIIYEDPKYPVRYNSYNGTHVSLAFSRDKKSKETTLPLKFMDKDFLKETSKQDLDVDGKEQVIGFDITKYDDRTPLHLMFGLNSTSIELNATTSNMYDDNFDNDSDRGAGDGFIWTSEMGNSANPDGFGVGRWKFDLGSLPDNASIVSVEFDAFRLSGDTGFTMDVWGSDNQTWVEGTFDDVNGNNGALDPSEYDTLWAHFDDDIGDFTTNPGMQDVNFSAFTTYFNDTFHAIGKNITIIFNCSSDGDNNLELGATEYGGPTIYLPHLYLVYEEMPEEAEPAQPSTEGFWSFNYAYYSFKISNETGRMVNLTYAGQSEPMLKEIRDYPYYDNETAYNTSNVSLEVYKADEIYDIIFVYYDLSYGGVDYGRTWKVYHAFNDSNRLYLADGNINAEELNTPLARFQSLFDSNDANNVTSRHEGSYSSYTLDSGGEARYNTTEIDSGSDASWIRAISTDHGTVAIATTNIGKNMDDVGHNYFNPSYVHNDPWDPGEVNNHYSGDAIFSHPNKTLYVVDNGSTASFVYDVSFTGRAGYSPWRNTDHELKVRGQDRVTEDIAEDTFRWNYLLLVIPPSQDIEANITDWENQCTYTSSEVSMLGNRFWPMHGECFINSQGDPINDTPRWQTACDMDENMDASTGCYLDFKLAKAVSDMKEFDDSGGWWGYSPISASSHGFWVNTFFGNAFTQMESFGEAIDSDRFKDTNETDFLEQAYLNKSLALQLNEDDIIGKYFEFEMNVTSTGATICVKNGKALCPTFDSSYDLTEEGGVHFYGVNIGGENGYGITNISIIDLDTGAPLFVDDFSTDNSSSYSTAGGGSSSYQVGYGWNITISGGQTESIYLDGSDDWGNWGGNITFHYWGDVSGFGKASGTGDDVIGGYINTVFKKNSTGGGTHYYLQRFHNEQTSTLTDSGGTRKGPTWMYFNKSRGVFVNDGSNSSAYLGRFQAEMFTEGIDKGQRILNQLKLYFSAAGYGYVIAQRQGDTTNTNRFRRLNEGIIHGLNYLVEQDNGWITPANCRADNESQYTYGQMQYSSAYIGDCGSEVHDDGYVELSTRVTGQNIRSLNNNSLKFTQWPAVMWYTRYGRENQSESNAGDMMLQAAYGTSVDTRTSEFAYECDSGYDDSISFQSKVTYFFDSEFNNGMGAECTNQTATFDGRTAIDYPDNHMIANWTDAVNVYLKDPDVRIRDGSKEQIVMHDKYQVENSTDIYLVSSLIDEPDPVWNYTLDEGMPAPDSWNNPVRWSIITGRRENILGTVHDWGAYTLDTNGSTFTVNHTFVNMTASTTYYVEIDGSQETSFSTDADGIGTVEYTVDDDEVVNITTTAAGDSCTTNSWDCSEYCSVSGLDAGGDTITATGTGTIYITGAITNCNALVPIRNSGGGCYIHLRDGGSVCRS